METGNRGNIKNQTAQEFGKIMNTARMDAQAEAAHMLRHAQQDILIITDAMATGDNSNIKIQTVA
jgi:hypothetical protein